MNQRYLGATLFCFALTAMGQEKKPVAYPEVAPGTGGLSYFLIGNSLTWDTVPSKLDGRTNQAGVLLSITSGHFQIPASLR